MCRAADLGRNRDDRLPARRVFSLVIQHHPHRAGAHLRRELVRRLARHSPILSGVGASGKAGAVQRPWSIGARGGKVWIKSNSSAIRCVIPSARQSSRIGECVRIASALLGAGVNGGPRLDANGEGFRWRMTGKKSMLFSWSVFIIFQFIECRKIHTNQFESRSS